MWGVIYAYFGGLRRLFFCILRLFCLIQWIRKNIFTSFTWLLGVVFQVVPKTKTAHIGEGCEAFLLIAFHLGGKTFSPK